jgi:hypothetical protein
MHWRKFGGGAAGNPIVLFCKSDPKGQNELWKDSGTTFTFTADVKDNNMGLAAYVETSLSHAVTLTINGKSYGEREIAKLTKGTYTFTVTITGSHSGTTKSGYLYIYGYPYKTILASYVE